MSSLKAEFEALKQQHQFTVMQLTDLKENYDRIKKLNATILQNMMKEPCDFFSQIKVIIEGDPHNQKIIQLQAELDKIRNNMHDQIQKRAQQIIKNAKLTSQNNHDCQNCQSCKRIWIKCPNCLKNNENYKNMQKIIEQKNSRIDKLKIQIDEKKTQIEVLSTKKNSQKSQKIIELEQINKILKSNVSQLEDLLRQQQIKTHSLNEQWQTAYNNLYQQYQNLLTELEQYKNYYAQEEQQRQQNYNNSQNNKKNHMVKEIQNILGQLGNRKVTNVNGNSQTLKSQKYNPSSSRMTVQDSDFSNFSIKDAINRPNQFTFF